MVQITLVEEQLADGKKLIFALKKAGISVTSAAWIRTTDNGMWYLYLASPIAASRNSRVNPYRPVQDVVRQQPQPFWVRPFDVKLIEPDAPITKGIQEIQQQYPPTKNTLHLGDGQLGGEDVEAAYIYPPPALLSAE